MGYVELALLAVGLSLDAFAVSVGKGLSQRKVRASHMVICGAWFGAFQFLMPVLGALLGKAAQSAVDRYAHWIAFALLALIGGNMIREALKKEEFEDRGSFRWTEMLVLAVATSIDAFAVGVSFALLSVRVVPASAFIGCTTFVLSAAGVKVGGLFGAKYGKAAEFAGWIILICIGLKILIEHFL